MGDIVMHIVVRMGDIVMHIFVRMGDIVMHIVNGRYCKVYCRALQWAQPECEYKQYVPQPITLS